MFKASERAGNHGDGGGRAAKPGREGIAHDLEWCLATRPKFEGGRSLMQEHGCAIKCSTPCPEAQRRRCAPVAEVEELSAVIERAPWQTRLVASDSRSRSIPDGVDDQRSVREGLLQGSQITRMLELQHLPSGPVLGVQHLRGTECPRVRRRAIDDEDGICPLA